MNPHIKNVCKIGQGHACCRYLLMGPKGWECAKFLPQDKNVQTLADKLAGKTETKSPKEIMDERAAAGLMIARADNCEGKSTEFLNS